MPRPKVPKGRKSVTKTISIYPAHWEHANKIAAASNVPLSRYVRLLIEADIRENILPRAITHGLNQKVTA